MKSTKHRRMFFWAATVLFSFCWLQPAVAATDVCSEGTGMPPFLTAGAAPNLLMLLDNSGSMLDMSYSTERTKEITLEDGTDTDMVINRCMDGDYEIVEYDNQGDQVSVEFVVGYVESDTYAGYFEKNGWYKWTETGYAAWQSGISYNTGDRVYAYGNIYEATITADPVVPSTGDYIDKDDSVVWELLFERVKWSHNTLYAAQSFVWEGPQLYYTELGGTSNDTDAADGRNLAQDTGVVWVAVDSTWMNNTSYDNGEVVSYKGILYQSTSADGTTSDGTGVYDDAGVTWTSLDQGSFVQTDESGALAYCENNALSEYARDDVLCVTLNESVAPKRVAAFAGKGNFLNWAMSSKFDIQKKILTGGKYSTGILDSTSPDGEHDNGMLITEHRGCSGSRFIKQVELDNGAGYLTLGVRGSTADGDYPFFDDRLDSTDDTARLEVIAITDDGFQPSVECEAALTYLLEHGMTGASANSVIDACFDTFPVVDEALTDQQPVMNVSLQFCSKFFAGGERDVNAIQGKCEELFLPLPQFPAVYLPSELVPSYGAYACYGIYDADLEPDERVGYIGRCWITGGTGGTKTCDPVDAVSASDGGIDGDGEYWDGGDLYKNEGLYNYWCENLNPALDGCQNDGSFIQLFEWSDGSGMCIEGSSSSGAGDADWENAADTDAVEACIIQASIDFCNDTSLPEVIDPSDQAGDTTSFWNVPALLTDSEVIAQLGADHPLAVMKGHISEPNRPEGVLHQVAQDLRLGAMAFHYVGASTECEPENLTTGIKRYCPQDNMDGAELLAAVQLGSKIVDNDDSSYTPGIRLHVDDLSGSVNDLRATSWTPLAEAMFGALGYFTENEKFCLNRDADNDCLDFPDNDSPIEYWCQDNHILVITEGESTADINGVVEDFVADPTDYLLSPEADDDPAAGDGDADTVDSCDDNLYSSTYFDDMTWWGSNVEPLYRERYLYDIDGNPNEKGNITTHVVVTGSLADNDDNECTPATIMQEAADNGGTNLYQGEDPDKLEANLLQVFSNILNRASAGSAASVISSSRSGSGAVYQAIFWPIKTDNDDNSVHWVGDVHALFMSSGGLMYEDSNGNGKLDPCVYYDNDNNLVGEYTDPDCDRQVISYYSEHAGRTRGCYDINGMMSNGFMCPDDGDHPQADGTDDFCAPFETDGAFTTVRAGAGCVEILDIKYLWSANEKLRGDYDKDTRNIYTWIDLDDDGVVDQTDEWIRFHDDVVWSDLNADVAITRGTVTSDFLTSDDVSSFVDESYPTFDTYENDAMEQLVSWINGRDQTYDETINDDNENDSFDKKLRSRQFKFGSDASTDTWRLGDIIHSTPISVARPAEAYHFIYRDLSYAGFAKRWATRRNMIYFGSNDGMMHAVNGGFYVEHLNQFCCSLDENDNCAEAVVDGSCSIGDDLGDELWAYIPQNLHPHLKCLASPSYVHKYYVDQKPRIVDVQIFAEEPNCVNSPNFDSNGELYRDSMDPTCIHAGGWGTILIGSMRFGGAPIVPGEWNGVANDNREFTSSFFILDITNPEEMPELLGEMTRTTEKDPSGTKDKYVDLNYTTSSPTMVVMRDDTAAAKTNWYLLMGNGPTDLDGTNSSAEPGKIAILPLAWLKNGIPFRIHNEEPSTTPPSGSLGVEGGVFEIPMVGSQPSFISDMITVDFDIEQDADVAGGARYKSDAVYFGTVDGSGFNPYPSPPAVDNDQTYWNGGGRLFRLVTKVIDGSGVEQMSKPSDWMKQWTTTTSPDPNNRAIRQLIDVKAPITAAPSVGYDGHNFWVYAGTGRFFDKKDKTDDGQYIPGPPVTTGKISYFGLKEPFVINSVIDGRNSVEATLLSGVNCSKGILSWAPIVWDVNTQDNTAGIGGLIYNGTPGERGLMQTDELWVMESTDTEESKVLCVECSDNDECQATALGSAKCYPDPISLNPPVLGDDSIVTFTELKDYIAGKGCIDSTAFTSGSTGLDGWYRDFHDARERNVGQAALLGGLLIYTGYQPYADVCKAEGQSFLYGVHYQTGTASTKSVFGTFYDNDDATDTYTRVYLKDGAEAPEGKDVFVQDRLSLGKGMATTPSMHVGTGDQAASAFVQTSTGEVIEVQVENLPINNAESGRSTWTDRCDF